MSFGKGGLQSFKNRKRKTEDEDAGHREENTEEKNREGEGTKYLEHKFSETNTYSIQFT